MTLRVTRWWWLRHAPVPDPEGRIIGRLDLPCDISDTSSFTALARLLPRQPVLVDSGMMRCAQTIGALEGAGMVLVPSITEPDFAEQDFGHWQGHTWNELHAGNDPDLPPFRDNPAEAVPPGGESFAALMVRVAATITKVQSDYAGRDIIAVAHAGTIRAALGLALSLPPANALSFVVDPLSLTRIDAVGDGWRIVGVNWTPAPD